MICATGNMLLVMFFSVIHGNHAGKYCVTQLVPSHALLGWKTKPSLSQHDSQDKWYRL